MSDLIERLRGENKGGDIGHEAADRIEELEAEVERLREYNRIAIDALFDRYVLLRDHRSKGEGSWQ